MEHKIILIPGGEMTTTPAEGGTGYISCVYLGCSCSWWYQGPSSGSLLRVFRTEAVSTWLIQHIKPLLVDLGDTTIVIEGNYSEEQIEDERAKWITGSALRRHLVLSHGITNNDHFIRENCVVHLTQHEEDRDVEHTHSHD